MGDTLTHTETLEAQNGGRAFHTANCFRIHTPVNLGFAAPARLLSSLGATHIDDYSKWLLEHGRSVAGMKLPIMRLASICILALTFSVLGGLPDLSGLTPRQGSITAAGITLHLIAAITVEATEAAIVAAITQMCEQATVTGSTSPSLGATLRLTHSRRLRHR